MARILFKQIRAIRGWDWGPFIQLRKFNDTIDMMNVSRMSLRSIPNNLAGLAIIVVYGRSIFGIHHPMSIKKQGTSNLSAAIRSWLTDKSVWLGVLVVGLVVAYIEIGRRLVIAVPIPFLLLLGVVVLVASIGGKRSGIVGAAVSSLFIFYSMGIDFGPATLTGGPLQASLGSALIVIVGFLLGRTRDQNRAFVKELERSRIELERRVEGRTAELSQANSQLMREMADRVQTQEVLQQREIYFQKLIDNAADIISVLDQDGIVLYESPSIKKVLGYEPEELIGTPGFALVHPEDAAKASDEFIRGLASENQPFSILGLRFRHKDGSWRLLEATGTNLLSDPIVGGIVINSRDITRRREMETQVDRQEKLAVVGQLAAGIAHDFNNVMAVILLYAELLEMSPNLTDKERKQVKTIYKEGTRAAKLTAQILDFGRQSILDRRPMDLMPFLKEFVTVLQQTTASNIQIDLTHDQDSYIISADSSRLHQALMNLVFNARDAMPLGGRIHLSLSSHETPPARLMSSPDQFKERWVKITISDNGSGIPDEAIDHIFEPFFTTKEPGKGTGLGLAQVYGIVKQHDGFVHLVSEPGTGTVITITLPEVVDERPNKPLPSPDALIKGNQEVILVAEDNEATRIALTAALESLNYQVIAVENGREALTKLNEHPEIVLIMSDVMMPEMGGIALLEILEEEGNATPFILLTGNSATEEMALLKASGRVESYAKPIPLDTLGEVVARRIGEQ